MCTVCCVLSWQFTPSNRYDPCSLKRCEVSYTEGCVVVSGVCHHERVCYDERVCYHERGVLSLEGSVSH